jgi:pimeloyl-ACP methyl ester carboxylesterase
MERHRGLLGQPGRARGGARRLLVAASDRAAPHGRNGAPERYDPDTWTDEIAHLARPGQREIQSALLYDYRTNVAAYPAWQAWLRQHRPPTLVAWGANDPSFIAAGATAFRADLPDAEIHLLDAGHFALDEKTDEIAGLILTFMAKHLPAGAPAGPSGKDQ